MNKLIILLLYGVSFVLNPTTSAKDLAPYDSDKFFETGRLVRVDLRMAEKDWNTMLMQHRSLLKTLRTDVTPANRDRFFDDFRAELSIDGVAVGPVSVRKKGFVGSLSPDRPSLKIRLDKFEKVKVFAGLTSLTLNNNRQDPTRVHQVIGYGLFRKAGIPSSRCNLAAVSVNGQPLGIYSNVESVDDRFIQRRFPKDEGTLWEGTVADFDKDAVLRFEKKFGPDAATKKILAIVEALKLPDAEVIEALSGIIDMNAFLRFWAMEVLTGHWDGYASNRNNYFIYYHAGNDRIQFMPWGIDQLGQEMNFLWGDPNFVPPKSVKAAAILTRRLYSIPQIRERYFEVMRLLLKDVWNEAELKRSFQTYRELLKDHPPKLGEFDDQPHAKLESYLNVRRGDIEKEMNLPYPDWKLKPFDPMGRVTKLGNLDVEFDLKRSGDPKNTEANGKAKVRMELNKQLVEFGSPSFKITNDKMPWGGERLVISINRAPAGPKDVGGLEISVFQGAFGAKSGGADLRVDIFASPAQARVVDSGSANTPFGGVAVVAGMLKLDDTDAAKGLRFKGQLSGELYRFESAARTE